MFCINIVNPGPSNYLVLKNAPIPNYSATQVLVRVKATAVNRADLLQRKGKYPLPKGASPILGLELAGDIVAMGDSVSGFSIGQRVMALVNGGAYAEYCVAEAALTAAIPDNWSYAKAASIPEALMTVQATVFELGKLHQKQTFMVHGAGSSIASFAIQMAKQTKARVITTVGCDKKIARAYALGAEKVLNYRTLDFQTCLENDSVDLILDFIGAEYLNKHLNLLKTEGKLLQIACMKGAAAECNLAVLLKKRLQITGFMLRPQSLSEKTRLWQVSLQKWLPLLLSEQIKPIIDSEFPLKDIEQAHARMQNSAHFGKIVINNSV